MHNSSKTCIHHHAFSHEMGYFGKGNYPAIRPDNTSYPAGYRIVPNSTIRPDSLSGAPLARDVTDPKLPFGSIFLSSCQSVAFWSSFGCWFRIWHSFYTSTGELEVNGSLWRHHSNGVILSNFDLTSEVNQWPKTINMGITVLLCSRGIRSSLLRSSCSIRSEVAFSGIFEVLVASKVTW